jgi:glucosamine 6-phosphate synthetase-like amidotransferase/phosphosugar isomerase protein
VALATEAVRGGDAFGFAWVDGGGRLRMFKAPGLLATRPRILEMAWDARLLVGHARRATCGIATAVINAHPHPCDGGWLCHNGTVPMHRPLADRYGVRPAGYCDSEVLAGLVEIAPRRTMSGRLAWALGEARQGSPQAALGLWSRPGQLLAARAGYPLAWSDVKGGIYLASLARHLPGRPRSFPDDSAHAVRAGGVGRRRQVPRPLAGGRPPKGMLF